MEKRRLKAVALFEQGHGPSAVARRLGVRRQSAHAWKSCWEQSGQAALKSKGPAGRKRRLTSQQEEALAQTILDGPEVAGYATAVWTLPRLATFIRQRYRVDYHPGHVWHLLGRLGFSCQRPTRRALKRTEAEIKRWHRQRWPGL
jgi:transposase